MLSISDVNIADHLPYFADLGLPVAFLVPTLTGMGKSIMDATMPVRELFKKAEIHDYSVQGQGPENKVFIEAYFMESDKLIQTTASLYRPITKQGDPRIWFSKLGSYADPRNLLALLVNRGSIYVINLSNPSVVRSLHTGFLRNVIESFVEDENRIANELLRKIKKIHDRGFIPSITRGDPGVGDTLENALGIPRNNNKTPDYKGIELKATRYREAVAQGQIRRRSETRTTLFDQVPDWGNSHGMNRNLLLDEYGYWSEQEDGSKRWNLSCTLRANHENGQGLFLEVDTNRDLLINYYAQTERIRRYVLQWSLQTLRERLEEKHPETFWVKATFDFVGEQEYFRYDYVKHTKHPNTSLIPSLLDEGIITVDYLMHRKPNGSTRDHGFPFKIFPRDMGLLFPEEIEYDLEKI